MPGQPGVLYLIPVTLGGDDPKAVLGQGVLRRLPEIRHFIVENQKSARRFLKSAGYPQPLSDIAFHVLDEHTKPGEIPNLLAAVLEGHNCGLLSEAGCPAIADPGAALVRLAHARNIRVVPLVGPSAIVLALMASGMNGQRFAFHGYLPIDAERRRQKLQELDRAAFKDGATQIFMEAPYRNQALLQALLTTCRGDTLLCLATDITLPSESIRTQSIARWKAETPDINRRPTVFLLAGSGH